MDVSLYFVRSVPPRDMVDNSVKIIFEYMTGRSEFPPPLAVVYLKIKSEGVPYVCMVGTTCCFEPRRPDKTLLKFRVDDVDRDLEFCVNDTLNGLTDGMKRVVQLSLVF